MFLRYVLLFLGVFASSTAVILIKSSHTHPAFLAAIRLLLAAAMLSPIFWLEFKRHRGAYTRASLQRTFRPAVVLALHFYFLGMGRADDRRRASEPDRQSRSLALGRANRDFPSLWLYLFLPASWRSFFFARRHPRRSTERASSSSAVMRSWFFSAPTAPPRLR
jgi:hypothetical protein